MRDWMPELPPARAPPPWMHPFRSNFLLDKVAIRDDTAPPLPDDAAHVLPSLAGC